METLKTLVFISFIAILIGGYIVFKNDATPLVDFFYSFYQALLAKTLPH